MKQFVGSFKEIAMIISQVGPDLDQAEKYGRGGVMIETEAMICTGGALVARTWGPFADEAMAHNYINIKRDRHRLSNAQHHGETGSTIENDRELLGHPAFKYRVIGCKGYFARYLAQIQLLCTGALVNLAMPGEKDVPFESPSDDYGILDEDEYLDDTDNKDGDE